MKAPFKKIIALILSGGFIFFASSCMMMTTQNTGNSSSSQSSKKEKDSSKKDKSSSKKDEEKSSEEEIDYSDYVDFVVEVEPTRNARVLQITDTQIIDWTQGEPNEVSTKYDPEKTEEFCYRYIRQVVERYDPDLILMTGDNVYGKFDDDGSMLTGLIEFMETLDTPWAPVFGNHDNESEMGVDWQCEQYENAENCLFMQRELTGNGNYSVGIVQGGKLQRVFFMLDSNGCASPSEATLQNSHFQREIGFGQDQIEWYEEVAEEIKEVSPKTKFSFAFHIQIDAFRYAYQQYCKYDIFSPVNLDENEEAQANGDFGYIGYKASGWDQDGRIWESIADTVGADSVFVGHEHSESASIVYNGVRFQFGQKSSQYDMYNKLINGKIVSDDTHEGTPILGGTKITLSKTNGAISGDTGLILWDPELDK